MGKIGAGTGKGKYPTRGFGSMDKARQREIASAGGKAAHKKGTAHEWNHYEAQQAGMEGGRKAAERRRQRIEAERATAGASQA